jgi:hypothetical protein
MPTGKRSSFDGPPPPGLRGGDAYDEPDQKGTERIAMLISTTNDEPGSKSLAVDGNGTEVGTDGTVVDIEPRG